VKIALGLLAALGVFALALIAGARSQAPPPCIDDEMRENVRAILLDGFALALKENTKRVFEIWLKDDSDQPKRAIAGMREGINAYVRARSAALNWTPPPCKGGKL
jgi:hypothetical protein